MFYDFTNHYRTRPAQQQQRTPVPPAPVPVPDSAQRFVPNTPQIVQQPRQQPQILPPRPNSSNFAPAIPSIPSGLDFDALIQARRSGVPYLVFASNTINMVYHQNCQTTFFHNATYILINQVSCTVIFICLAQCAARPGITEIYVVRTRFGISSNLRLRDLASSCVGRFM